MVQAGEQRKAETDATRSYLFNRCRLYKKRERFYLIKTPKLKRFFKKAATHIKLLVRISMAHILESFIIRFICCFQYSVAYDWSIYFSMREYAWFCQLPRTLCIESVFSIISFEREFLLS